MRCSDISDPDLVSCSGNYVLDEMGEYGMRVIDLDSPYPYSFHLTDKFVLAYYPEYSLVLPRPSVPMKLSSHSSVAITRKRQTDSLDLIRKVHIFLELLHRLLLGLIVECVVRKFHELTSSLDTVDEVSVGSDECPFLPCPLRVLCKAFLKTHFLR